MDWTAASHDNHIKFTPGALVSLLRRVTTSWSWTLCFEIGQNNHAK